MVPMIFRRGLTAFLIASLAIFCLFQLSQKPANAASPQLYDWYANTTNFYTDRTFIYLFENLDSTTQYTMYVQELNLDGTVLRNLHVLPLTQATTTTFGIAADNWPVGFGINNDRSYAPIRIVDQYGQILGSHWVSLPCHIDWDDFTDEIAFADGCRNEDTGLFHSKTTPNNSSYNPSYPNVTWLHYRTATSTTNRVKIFNMRTNAEVEELRLDDAVEFQINTYFCNVAVCSSNAFSASNAENNFIAVSTNGVAPTGVFSFARTRSYNVADDPNLTSFTNDAFDYAEYTAAGSFLFAGESVYLQSLRTTDTSEWSIVVSQSKIEPSETQKVILTTLTENIGNVYIQQIVVDSQQGEVDNDTYSYQKNRNVTFTVSAVEQTGVTVEWTVTPEEMDFAADPAAYEFEITSSSYEITQFVIPPFTETAKAAKTELGLDTTFGSTVLLVFFWFLGFALVNKVSPRNYFLQVIMFGLIGTMYIFIFDPPTILKLLFAFGVVFLMIMIIRNPQGEST